MDGPHESYQQAQRDSANCFGSAAEAVDRAHRALDRGAPVDAQAEAAVAQAQATLAVAAELRALRTGGIGVTSLDHHV